MQAQRIVFSVVTRKDNHTVFKGEESFLGTHVLF